MSRRYPLPWGVLVLLAFLPLAPADNLAKPTFQNPLFEMDVNLGALCLVDLTGDGNLDMVVDGVYHGGASRLWIRLGNGDGTFGRVSQFTAGDNPIFIASADLNEDGKQDLVLVNGDSDDLSVLLGDGLGSFAPETRLAVGNWPQSVAIGDVNEDGHLDLITANRIDDDVSLLMGDGSGSFAAAVSLSAGNGSSAVALGDLDGDGHVDMVVADSYSNDLMVKMGNGDGTFQNGRSVSTSEDPVNVFIKDVNSDAIPDLIADGLNDVSIHLGTGNGHFLAPTTVPAVGTLALGQFAGDGNSDLLLAHENVVDVYPGTGDGTFLQALTTHLNFLGAFTALATGDINGDGVSDFISGVQYTNSVGVFLGKGDGTFPDLSQITIAPSLSYYESLAVGTFDADASADLVVAAADALYFLKGNGDGSFGAPAPIPSSGGSRSVIAGDVNGDGNLDIISMHAGSDSVAVFLGNGKGRFALAGTSPVGDAPFEAAAGDFDRDGNLDLVVVNDGWDLSLLLGHGDGTFEPEIRFPQVGVQPWGVVVADLNRDMAADIAVATYNPDSLSIFFGNGDGTFQPETALPSRITRHEPLVVSDFNADGKDDLAVGGQPARIEVFLGNGDGTFQIPTLYRTPGSAGLVEDLTVGDFNGDGIQDLASVSEFNMVLLFTGVGDGRFLPESGFLCGAGSDAIASADFNGDGIDDLAVAGGYSDKVTILLSRATSAGPCQDSDGDGFGDPGNPTCPAGALPDCDDSNANISPLAADDECDGIDQNCDGLDGTDNDADGFTPCTGDCDESSPYSYNIFPGAQEYCDGVDEDCDGSVDVPAEVGKDLIFSASGQTLSWSPPFAFSIAYNVYRGSLGPGAFAFDQACFVSALTTPQAADTDPIPVPDQGYYYLVSGSNSCGEGTLGFLSDLEERPNLLPCP